MALDHLILIIWAQKIAATPNNFEVEYQFLKCGHSP
jgi:hypothetical protein